MRTSTRRTTVVMLTCTLLASACGGDADSGSTGPTSPSISIKEPAGAATSPAPTPAPASDPTVAAPTTDPTNEAGTAAVDPALIAAAETEGSVTVYSFTSRIAAVEEAFETAYPKIDLVGVDISSTEQITRIKAEVDAGNVEADVAYIADAPVVLNDLVAGGYLEQYVPATAADALPDEFETPLVAHRLSTKVLMYNEEAHPDGSPVTNLWQLTTPEWAGKVVLVDPLQRGDYLDFFTQIAISDAEMATAYEEEFGAPIDAPDAAGEAWIEAMLANDPVLTDDTDNVNAAVGALGQTDPPVGITSYSDRRDNEDEGWALQVATGVSPSPGIAYPALLGLVKGAKHPAAAGLFINFMFGDGSPTGGPAYQPFYVAGDYATRSDIVPHPDAASLDELGAWIIDPNAIAGARDEVADLILLNL